MNVTKRDIADIMFVWMALWLLLTLLTSLVTLGTFIGMTGEAEKYTDKSTAVIFHVLHTVALLFLNYLLLFKRSLLLTLIVPDGKERELSIPPALAVLASYTFWIRLLGIFTFLSSTIRFLSRLATDLAEKRAFDAGSFWMYNTGTDLVSAVLASLVVWKAEWIADKIGRMGVSNHASHTSSESAPSADSEVA